MMHKCNKFHEKSAVFQKQSCKASNSLCNDVAASP